MCSIGWSDELETFASDSNLKTKNVRQDGWRTSGGGFADAYLGLKITRVIRVARLFVTISFFVPEASLAFDHSR